MKHIIISGFVFLTLLALSSSTAQAASSCEGFGPKKWKDCYEFNDDFSVAKAKSHCALIDKRGGVGHVDTLAQDKACPEEGKIASCQMSSYIYHTYESVTDEGKSLTPKDIEEMCAKQHGTFIPASAGEEDPLLKDDDDN